MAKKSTKYTGKLAVPIYLSDCPNGPRGLLSRLSDEHIANEKQWLAEQLAERVGLLFEHYAMASKFEWGPLAVALAMEHVPGFRVEDRKKRTGPATFWSPSRYCELLSAVEKLKLEKNCLDSEACQIIATAPRFAKAAWHSKKKQSKRSLETRLSEARNPKFNWLARVLVDQSDPLFQETMRDLLIRAFGLNPGRTYGIAPSQNDGDGTL